MFFFVIFTVPGYVGGGAQVLPVFLLACVPLQVSNVIAAIDWIEIGMLFLLALCLVCFSK